MDIRTASKTGPQVPSFPVLLQTMAEHLRIRQPDWLQQLTEHPERFADLEVQVHLTFQNLADQLVAGLLAQASQQSSQLQDAKKK